MCKIKFGMIIKFLIFQNIIKFFFGKKIQLLEEDLVQLRIDKFLVSTIDFDVCFVFQDNSKWINGMDEQIMFWVIFRFEVSKDEDDYMVVFSKFFDFKCLCVCVLVFFIEVGIYLVFSICLFE